MRSSSSFSTIPGGHGTSRVHLPISNAETPSSHPSAALAWIHEEVAGPVLALPADDEEVGNLEPRIQRWCSGLASRAASLGPASARGEPTHESPSEVRLIMTL